MAPIDSRVVIEGSGPPLLLVHGMGGPNMWRRAQPALGRSFRTIWPTLPGFREDDAPVDYHDLYYVEWLEALRARLGIERWSVAGVSLGGRAVLHYAALHPERVERVVTIAPAAFGPVPLAGRPLVRAVGRRVLGAFLSRRRLCELGWRRELAHPDTPAGREVLGWIPPTWRSPAMVESMIRMYLETAAAEPRYRGGVIRAPVLVLWGADDKAVPLSRAWALARELPAGQVKVLPGYRHLALVENPDFCVEAITAFLGAPAPASSPPAAAAG